MSYVCIIMYVHAYYCGHMFEQVPSPASANITLPFGDLINADFCRCIEMFTPRRPSVCITSSLTCSTQQLVWLSISLECNVIYLCCLLNACAVPPNCGQEKQIYYVLTLSYLWAFSPTIEEPSSSSAHVKALKTSLFGDPSFSNKTIHTVQYSTYAVVNKVQVQIIILNKTLKSRWKQNFQKNY